MFAGAHGVRGELRLRSFTDDPVSIFRYKPLTDEKGERVFALTRKGIGKDAFIVSVAGVADRDAADAMKGVKLFVERAQLPKAKKNQYYEADLIGMTVHDAGGVNYGRVLAVHDYGAGPFLEIGTGKKDSFMLPFTNACVPEVDAGRREILAAVPDGWLKDEKEEDEGEA